jgi:DNA-directed RNA polymerase subunit H
VSKEKTVEEKRAALILKYRNLKIDKEEREGDNITYYLSRGEEKFVMLCLINQKTIGIAYVRELRDLVEKTGADKGIMVGNGKYTYSAGSSAPKLKVELIPRTLPVFDIFDHEMVSKAEIVSDEEKQELVEKYHAQLYQFPWVKASDPVSIILGAEPGDVISIKTKSETAGTSDSYRYVV